MLTMHGRIQKILSGGLGVLRSLFKFFYFTEGSADLTSLSKQLVVNNSISKETYNKF